MEGKHYLRFLHFLYAGRKYSFAEKDSEKSL